MTDQIQHAVTMLKRGSIIAYPTEGVYGLGCDPFRTSAVNRLRKLKDRAKDQGFILIASQWAHVAPLVQCDDPAVIQRCQASWPGPMTWILPAAQQVPYGVRDKNDTIAIRITDHPLAQALCEAFQGPLVSTSANFKGEAPLTTYEAVVEQFSDKVDYIVPGKVGSHQGPTEIWDAITGQRIR